jgi:hypothetical protein
MERTFDMAGNIVGTRRSGKAFVGPQKNEAGARQRLPGPVVLNGAVWRLGSGEIGVYEYVYEYEGPKSAHGFPPYSYTHSYTQISSGLCRIFLGDLRGLGVQNLRIREEN